MFILQFTSPEVVGEYNVINILVSPKDFIQFEKNPFDFRNVGLLCSINSTQKSRFGSTQNVNPTLITKSRIVEISLL